MEVLAARGRSSRAWKNGDRHEVSAIPASEKQQAGGAEIRACHHSSELIHSFHGLLETLWRKLQLAASTLVSTPGFPSRSFTNRDNTVHI